MYLVKVTMNERVDFTEGQRLIELIFMFLKCKRVRKNAQSKANTFARLLNPPLNPSVHAL